MCAFPPLTKSKKDYNSIKPFYFHLETQTSTSNDLLIAGKFANYVHFLHHLNSKSNQPRITNDEMESKYSLFWKGFINLTEKQTCKQ